jgi:hypothetical protein
MGFWSSITTMAPKKATKKNEKVAEVSSTDEDVVSDTILHAIDSIKSWRHIFETLDYEITNFPHDANNKLWDIEESELHKVDTLPRLLTYNDMINWDLEQVDMQTRSILDIRGVVIGSFRPKHIQVMYKLSSYPKYIYNKDFVSEFQRKQCFESDHMYPDIIKDWWRNKAKFKADTHVVYPTTSLNEYIVYVAMMLCRIFGKEIPTHFPVEWVPILHEAAKGYNFNWDKILSDNIIRDVMEYQTARSKGQTTSFYMYAYIMDVVCLSNPFPLMNWSWNPTYPLIRIIFSTK